MQSTGIQPSQLLMEVLAGAQEKIGQGISKSGFSQQLNEQHQLVQNASLGQPTALTQQPTQPSNTAAAPKESSPELPSEGCALLPQPSALSSGGKVKGSLLSSAASRNMVVSKWKITQELTFADPMPLENVLAQFHLAPSVSAAIRNTLDDNGRISLQKLNQVLDRVSSGQSELPPDGRAAADQIRSLLAGLLQQNQLPVQNYQALEIRTKSAYDFGEFRDLLRRLVEQIAKTNVKQSGKSPLQHPSEFNSAADKPATEGASTFRAKLPNQTKSLAANLIPSFLRDERDPPNKLKSTISEVATLPLSDDQSSKLPFLAANKIHYSEGFGGEQKSGRPDGATDRLEAAESGSLAARVSVMGGLPYVFLEAVSELSSTAPLKTSAGPTIEVSSMEAQASSPTIRAGNPTLWAANSPLISALISKESALPLATSIPDKVFSAGERLVGLLRPAPLEQDFNTESNLTARTLSAKTSVPVVEKIAAPARADFTQNHSDSSGNHDSVSEYRSTASPQSPPGPPGTAAETLSANSLPEFSIRYPKELARDLAERPPQTARTESNERSAAPVLAKAQNSKEIFRDVTSSQMTAPPGGTGENSNVSEPPKVQNLKEIFRDVTRLQMTTHPGDPGASSTVPESAKIQNPREILRDVAPLQMKASPEDAGQKAATPHSVKMQTPAEISGDGNRPQMMAPPTDAGPKMAVLQAAKTDQPGTSNQNIVFPRSQSRHDAQSSAVGPASFPTQAIMEQSTSNQTLIAQSTVKDTPLDSSNKNPLPTIPAQNSAALAAIKNAEDAAGNSSQKKAVTTANTNEGPPKVAVGTLHVRGITRSDFGIPAQPLTTEEGSFSADFGKESIGSESAAGVATWALSDDQLVEWAHLPEGHTRQQTQNSTVSCDRLAQTQQDPETLSVAQKTVMVNTKDFVSPAENERAVPKPARSNPPRNLIQPLSNRQDSDFGESDPKNPPTVPRPGASELKTNAPTPLSQEALPVTPKPGFQNSIELLANSPSENEMTAGRSAPASQGVAEQASRFTSIESNSAEAPTQRNFEKAVTATQTSDQSPRQGQGQEHTPPCFKDGLQTMSLPANPSADKAADMFSGHASSLASELAQRIQELYKQKRHELTLELEPKHLGRLLVRIGTDDNQVSTLIATDSEQIKELLSRSAPVLRQELASQGLILEKLQIDVNSQNAAQDQSFQNRNSSRRKNVSDQQAATSGKGLAAAGVRRIHIGRGETLVSLFV